MPDPFAIQSPRSGGWPRHPLLRSKAGLLGFGLLVFMLAACLLTLPYTLGSGDGRSPRFDEQVRAARQLPPWWAGVPSEPGKPDSVAERIEQTAKFRALERISRERGGVVTLEQLERDGVAPTPEQFQAARPRYWMGTDVLGRSLLIRTLAGGGISLTIGLSAALLSVMVGTLYGALAGYIGGRTDALLMRVVDVLYGLPYILLVVLLSVAVSASLDNWQLRRISAATKARAEYLAAQTASAVAAANDDPELAKRLAADAMERFGTGELSPATTQAIGILTLVVAIGGVSWLTMARVVRGQVLSLKHQPFMEAARAMGVPVPRQFTRHLLPNLVGPITVYATLTVPQAILQESFLSFLGIGVRSPLPSWGNLAADGLGELNPYESRWWLLLFPCLMLGMTLLSLNFVGEGLREALDPKSRQRRS